MKFGLNDKDYEFIKNALQKELGSKAKVYAFGSRARGDHSEFSDLDLMVTGEGDFSNSVGRLEEVFSESNLPIKVDLVIEVTFAKSYESSYLIDRKLF